MASPIPHISSKHAQPPLFAGVDVGGTTIKIALVDDLGRTITATSIPTDEHRGPDDAVGRIAECLSRLMSDCGFQAGDVACVGLGTPGTMDIPRGVILEPPNMPNWRDFPIRDALANACGKQVFYANDAGAAAYGEYWVGSGQEFFSIVMLTLGTGVGGGIIIGGLSIDGENSHGAECGHIIIDSSDSARVCSCGQKGHLEGYASATALIQRAHEALDAGQPSTLNDRVKAGQALTGLALSREAEAGDALSLRLILETADYLTVAIVTLIHTIDPGAVILGGAMNFGGDGATVGRRFIDRIREGVRKRAFPVPAKRTQVRFAMLGGSAGYIGAAGIAREGLRQKATT